MQRLVASAAQGADRVRNDLRQCVMAFRSEPNAVLIVMLDETGFLKKGIKSTGVARPYSSTPSLNENRRIEVFLAYAAPDGAALSIAAREPRC
jgi:SRSO17 transposase